MLPVTINVLSLDNTLLSTHSFRQDLIRIGTKESAHVRLVSESPISALLQVVNDQLMVVVTGVGILLDDAPIRHTAAVPSGSVLAIGNFRLEVLTGAETEPVEPTEEELARDAAFGASPELATALAAERNENAAAAERHKAAVAFPAWSGQTPHPSFNVVDQRGPLYGRPASDEIMSVRQLQETVALARQNPPTDPLGRLQLGLLICDAESRIADAEEERRRKLQRSTLPEGAYAIRRRNKRFVVFFAGREIDEVSSAARARQQAWEHHLHPEEFEADIADEAEGEEASQIVLFALACGLHDMRQPDPVAAALAWSNLPPTAQLFYTLFAAEVLKSFDVCGENTDSEITPEELAIALHRCESTAFSRYAAAFPPSEPGYYHRLELGGPLGTPYALLPLDVIEERQKHARYLAGGFAFIRRDAGHVKVDADGDPLVSDPASA